MTTPAVPVVVLASTDPVERDVAILTALIDAPGVVAVIHELEPDECGDPELLRRVVTRAGEHRSVIPLEHACPGCAMREDAVPAIVELLDEEPAGIVLALPLQAEILPATRTLTAAIRCGALNGARLAGTVSVVSGRHLLDALDDGDDAVVAQIVDAAIVVTTGGGRQARDIVDGLRSPMSVVMTDACEPWLARATTLLHDEDALEHLSDPRTMVGGHGLREAVSLPDGTRVAPSGVWEMELRSHLPVHPERLMRVVQALGAQGSVSRGRFWVANRPDAACGWDAVCGQVTIGVVGPWEGEERETFLSVVGFDADPARVRAAFRRALLTEAEHARGAADWIGRPDPLAPYLGDPAALYDIDGAA